MISVAIAEPLASVPADVRVAARIPCPLPNRKSDGGHHYYVNIEDNRSRKS